jgi:hypothetical protein
LIKTLEEIHPSDFNTISSYVADCGNFLKNFDSVFSLNYDLLLYWINVNQNIFKDGFGGANNSGTVDNIFHIRYFAKKETCDLHYLHGGLHLFMLDDGSIVKLCRRHARGEQEGRFLLNEISQVILSYKVLPLFVAEGSSTAKLKKIRSNIYLLNAYEKLSLLKDSVIFIYGHSASISDEHIYNAIKDKNNLLYFSIYDESQLEDIKENLTSFGIKPEEVVFVDSKSVNLKNK